MDGLALGPHLFSLFCGDVCVCNYCTNLPILRPNVQLCIMLVQRYHVVSALASHNFCNDLERPLF